MPYAPHLTLTGVLAASGSKVQSLPGIPNNSLPPALLDACLRQPEDSQRTRQPTVHPLHMLGHNHPSPFTLGMFDAKLRAGVAGKLPPFCFILPEI